MGCFWWLLFNPVVINQDVYLLYRLDSLYAFGYFPY